MAHPQADAQWATDNLYSAPATLWDGDPTKVEPPAGKTAQGWYPTEEPPAEMQNDWMHKVGALLDYLHLIRVQNWGVVRDISGSGLVFNGFDHDNSTGTLIATGNPATTVTRRSTDGGTTWAAPTTAPTSTTGTACASDGAGHWVIGGGAVYLHESSDDGDNWTSRALPDALDAVQDVVWDSANGLWIAVGSYNGGVSARLFTSPDRITWTQRVDTANAGSFTRVWTSNSGVSVALRTGTPNQFYWSDDGLVWSPYSVLDGGGLPANALWDVVYSEAAGLWVITGQINDGTAAAWISTDGVNFNIPAGQVIPDLQFDSISCDQGELFVALATGGVVYASTDRGLTWTQQAGIGAMPRGPAATSLADPTRIRFGAGRFFFADSLGDFWASLAST